MSSIGLDFETFGAVSLPEVGLDRYVSDPSFRLLLAAVVRRDPITGKKARKVYDFVTEPDPEAAFAELANLLTLGYSAVAHNAGFERAVLERKGVDPDSIAFRDSAVLARAAGAGSSLEAAAPQLVGADKMPDGRRLIQKFSVPMPDGTILVDQVDDWDDETWQDWQTFKDYCLLDAELSWEIDAQSLSAVTPKEYRYEYLTSDMNRRGWPVDLELVDLFQERYEENLERLEREFREKYDPDGKLNFRSSLQLSRWCKERGINARSFTRLNVEKLIKKIEQQLASRTFQLLVGGREPVALKRAKHYEEVLAMLRTKQALGGSSLSKLPEIKKTVGADGRLRHQYLHGGAGQSMRTSGRGVQLQNIPRLSDRQEDLSRAGVMSMQNDQLASNLRQLFRASHPDGKLVVGDFSSIESRGLAYLAGAEHKLDAFRQGLDLYKVLASSMMDTPYESVTADQRNVGKVGELSCGYGAGPKAVQSFAEGMGQEYSIEQTSEIVNAWRDTNPEIVDLWRRLDSALREAVAERRETRVILGPEASMRLDFVPVAPPTSITRERPGTVTVVMSMFNSYDLDQPIMRRHFQGCFIEGKQICYLKPSARKEGPLWIDRWFKDGDSGRYTLYGGKLAGILTQSFCREIFFDSMMHLDMHLSRSSNARLIGQFHDELVVEWLPETPSESDGTWQPLGWVVELMRREMSRSRLIPDLPMAAEVAADYRYVK